VAVLGGSVYQQTRDCFLLPGQFHPLDRVRFAMENARKKCHAGEVANVRSPHGRKEIKGKIYVIAPDIGLVGFPLKRSGSRRKDAHGGMDDPS